MKTMKKRGKIQPLFLLTFLIVYKIDDVTCLRPPSVGPQKVWIQGMEGGMQAFSRPHNSDDASCLYNIP